VLDVNDSDLPDWVREELDKFAKHLVSVGVIAEKCDENGNVIARPEAEMYSGFVMEFGEEWYWITAGHCIKQVEIELPKNHYKTSQFRLKDTYASDARCKVEIPLEWESAWKFYVFGDESNFNGLDFGAVELRVYPKSWKSVNLLRCLSLA